MDAMIDARVQVEFLTPLVYELTAIAAGQGSPAVQRYRRTRGCAVPSAFARTHRRNCGEPQGMSQQIVDAAFPPQCRRTAGPGCPPCNAAGDSGGR